MRPLGIQPDRTAILVGAGASVDAGIPAAWPLLDHILDECVPTQWARDALLQLTRHPRPDQRNLQDFLRFEQVLDEIGKTLDPDLRLLDFVAQHDLPGSIHRRIAAATIGGAKSLTTNFDSLLEFAVAELGAHPRTRHIRRPAADTPQEVQIHKLHGSLLDVNGASVTSSVEPIHATVSLIARLHPGLVIDEALVEAMQELLDGRTVVVIGYSASDDLDLVPALLRTTPANVVWIDHQTTDVGEVQLRRTPDRPKWQSFLMDWTDRRTAFSGRTSTVLDALGFELPTPPRGSSDGVDPIDWKHHVSDWRSDVEGRDPTGLGLASHLFSTVDRQDLRLRALRESVHGNDPIVGFSRSERKYELAQCLYQSDGDAMEVQRLIADARDLADVDNNVEVRQLSDGLMARLRLWQGRFREAVELFADLVDRAEPGSADWAYATGQQGRALLYGRDIEPARPLLETAIPAIEATGDLVTVMDMLTALFYCHHELGDNDSAREPLGRLQKIAESVGDTKMLCQTLTMTAQVHQSSGRVQEALTHAREAARLGRLASHTELNQALDVLGSLEYQAGYPHRAVRRYREAMRFDPAGDHDQWYRAALTAAQFECGFRRAARRSALQCMTENAAPPSKLIGIATFNALGEVTPRPTPDLVDGFSPHPETMILANILVRLGARDPSLLPMYRAALDAARKFGSHELSVTLDRHIKTMAERP